MRAILDAAFDCVVVIDALGHVLEWNGAAETTFGYTRGEAVGRPLADLIVPPELREGHRRGLMRQAVGEEPTLLGQRIAVPAIRADGRRLMTELAVVKVAGGESAAFAGCIRDVTEGYLKEGALRNAASGRKGLIELSQAALEGRPVSQLMQGGVDLVVQQLEPDSCQIWELLPEQEQFVVRASAGATAAQETLSIPADERFEPGYALSQGKPVIVGDFEREPRFAPTPRLAGQGITSGVTVPIPGGDRGLGVVALHWRESHRLLDDQVAFLEALVVVLGSALQRTRSEERLQGVEREYRALVDRLPVVVYVAGAGPRGSWSYVSPQIGKLLGYTPSEWMRDPGLWISRVHRDDREEVLAARERCATEGLPLEVEYRMLARDGRLIWVRDEASVRRQGEDKSEIEGILIDITEQRAAHEELRYEANHDRLTGLYNRRRFEHALAAMNGEGGAVVAMGIDHLKLVNDSLGPSAGDTVLRGVATAIDGALLRGEVIARLGGDEFALLVPGASVQAARERAMAVLDAVRSQRTSMPVTASAGVAAFTADGGLQAEDALMAADIALHQAKEEGRDRVVVFSGREDERLAWVGRVRAAIEKERLLLHSQPIIDVRSGEQVAEELLVRMRGDGDELIPPSSFLPTAERFGLIREIDTWVVRQALKLAASGRSVNVNLSARSVGDAELPMRLGRELRAAGADPSRIVFEITETAAASQVESLKLFAERLHELGCGVALDDFGVGFGTLRYLKHLAPRYLKIDLEFVRGLTSSDQDERIVRSIVTMARGCGIRTVAEGVEDAETLTALRLIGVDYAQGFHLGRPAPVSD